MGLIGSLILAIVPAALSDQHGEMRAVALSEANVISSLIATAAAVDGGVVRPLDRQLATGLGGCGSYSALPIPDFREKGPR